METCHIKMDLITRRLEHQVEHDRLMVVPQGGSGKRSAGGGGRGEEDGRRRGEKGREWGSIVIRPCGLRHRIGVEIEHRWVGPRRAAPHRFQRSPCYPEKFVRELWTSDLPTATRLVSPRRLGGPPPPPPVPLRSHADLMRPAQLPDLVSVGLKHGTTLTVGCPGCQPPPPSALPPGGDRQLASASSSRSLAAPPSPLGHRTPRKISSWDDGMGRERRSLLRGRATRHGSS